MSTSIHVHGPFTFNTERIEGDRGGFAVIRVTAPGATVTLMRPSADDLDGLIRAALTALDLLQGGYPEQPPPDAGDSDPGGAS